MCFRLSAGGNGVRAVLKTLPSFVLSVASVYAPWGNRFNAVPSKSWTILDGKCSEIAALTISTSNRRFCMKPVHRPSAGGGAEH